MFMNMKGKILALTLVLATSVGGAEVAVGDEIKVLRTNSGRVFENVTVRKILPHGLLVIHSSGSATIPASELPQYQALFESLEQAAPKMAVKTLKEAKEIWLPVSSSDVVDCSLLVNITKKIGEDSSVMSGGGSAFLCNIGDQTYIYSNVHNFDGTIEFTITHRNGVVYDDFASVEVAKDGSAIFKGSGWGGDVLRIRLKNYREKALSLDPVPLDEANAKGRKILITGNTRGAGRITELEGLITNIVPERIIEHNVTTEKGNSGSPIVDLETMKVLGILTWGGYDSDDPLMSIWSKRPPEEREGINWGAGLATVAFVPSSFDELHKQRIVMNQLKKNIRLLGLLDSLVPTNEGLFVDTSQIVMGQFSIADLLSESPDHPVVKELVALDKMLQDAAKSNIKKSNQDIFKAFIQSYGRCLRIIGSQRRSIENARSATFYMKCSLGKSRALEICRAYEVLTARSLQWYRTQVGTGGTSIPLGSRLRLPSPRSGLKGIGLKE